MASRLILKEFDKPQRGLSHDFQAARADLVERVFLCVPVIVQPRLAAELKINQIDRRDSRPHEGHVVVKYPVPPVGKVVAEAGGTRSVESLRDERTVDGD